MDGPQLDDLPPGMTRLDVLLEHAGLEKPWTSNELATADVTVSYLVDGVLAVRQPAIIAGAYKSLKTTTAIDLSISLAGPRKFLNTFWVPEQKRVLMFSAESGKGAIQETAKRIAASKGLVLGDELPVFWGWWVPKASTDTHRALLRELIDHFKVDVVVIDPLYLSLSGEIQANLSLAGDQIAALTQECVRMGVTPVCVDHVKRSSENAKNFQPLELGDVSGAGKAEYFRQWILIGRREKFDPESMLHRLWLTVGGNDGHSGQWALDIDESRTVDDAGNEVRQWLVSMSNQRDAIEDAADRKADERRRQADVKLKRHAQQMRDAFVGSGTNGLTKTAARNRAGLNPKDGDAAIGKLLRDDILEECQTKNGGGSYDGFRLTSKYRESPNDEG